MQLRNEALILLRGFIINTEKHPGAWPSLTPGVQAHLRQELLLALEAEQNDVSRNYLCDLIAELGAMVLKGGANRSCHLSMHR